MDGERNFVKMLEGKGRIELVKLAGLFLPSQPVRVWEKESDSEEYDEECENCESGEEEEW